MIELIALLKEDPRARSWLSALDFGLVEGHCPSGCEHRVFEQAKRHFQAARALGHRGDHLLAWKSLQLAVAETPVHPPEVRENSTPLKKRRRRSRAEVTHVTTAHAMETYHFQGVAEALAGTLAWHYQTDNSERLEIYAELLKKLASQGAMAPKSDWRLGHVRCWISATPLAVEQGDTATPASFNRDARGLVHYTTAHFLVAYRLDADYLPAPTRPAAIDGVGTRFRAWCDGPQRSSAWGAAVHLRKFALGEPKIDGATEALVPAHLVPSSALRQVIPLGHPGADDGITERGQVPDIDDHAAFDRRIQEEAMRLQVSYQRVLLRIIKEKEDKDGQDPA